MRLLHTSDEMFARLRERATVPDPASVMAPDVGRLYGLPVAIDDTIPAHVTFELYVDGVLDTQVLPAGPEFLIRSVADKYCLRTRLGLVPCKGDHLDALPCPLCRAAL